MDGSFLSARNGKALRQEMRKKWDIPAEACFKYSGPDWLPIMLSNIPKEKRSMVLMILWRSWHLRNDVIHEKGNCTIKDSVDFLDRYLLELGLSKAPAISLKGKEAVASEIVNPNASVLEITGQADRDERIRWKPPEFGWIKINVDASLIKDSGFCSLGCVARDHRGTVLWAANRTNVTCDDTFSAELLECAFGLENLKDRPGYSVILESDNFAVIDAISKRSHLLSNNWKVFQTIGFLSSLFPQFRTSKVRREGNEVAHQLAALARGSGLDSFWRESVPLCVEALVCMESVTNDISE